MQDEILLNGKQQKPEEQKKNYKDIFNQSIEMFKYIRQGRIYDEIYIITHGDAKLTEEIYWFIPTIVFMLNFPDIKYANGGKYIVYYEDGRKEYFFFSENETYKEAYRYIEVRYRQFSRRKTLSILSNCREFQTTNNVLNKGNTIEDLRVKAIYIHDDRDYSKN